MKTLAIGILLAIVSFSTKEARASAALVDRSTGVKFDSFTTVGGTRYECLGAGVRKVLFFKAYAVTYCVEASRADELVAGYVRSRHPDLSGEALGDRLEEDERFFEALADSSADKLVIMQLVRDISKEKIAGAFRTSLSEVLPHEKVERLISTIPGDGKDGQRILIHSHGDTLVIDIAGDAKKLEDAQISRKLWRVWLGPDSVSSTLKESIAQRAAARIPPRGYMPASAPAERAKE
ncbi:hypothetical protein AKJ08_0157 [Vulgatibacter incomptus]|uniref:Chalcone isomerase domain-containing protein n=2 Tax=Vulgatibacter incomptus TaxID=1391653 RepID=A0A0K1P8C8_9BACT|nr:hypothetical protein AKJ08_0157 [Vulgatibacter incomptus]